MLWVAALLSSIIWAIGWSSGFLGSRIHLFLFFALLAILAACVPRPGADELDNESPAATDGVDTADPNAKSVPGRDDPASAP